MWNCNLFKLIYDIEGKYFSKYYYINQQRIIVEMIEIKSREIKKFKYLKKYTKESYSLV